MPPRKAGPFVPDSHSGSDDVHWNTRSIVWKEANPHLRPPPRKRNVDISDEQVEQLVRDVRRRTDLTRDSDALRCLEAVDFDADQAVRYYEAMVQRAQRRVREGRPPPIQEYEDLPSENRRSPEARRERRANGDRGLRYDQSKEERRDALVADLVGITGLEPKVAKELLIAGDWNIERIVETCFNRPIADDAEGECGSPEGSEPETPSETEDDDDPLVEVEVPDEEAEAAIAELTSLTGLRPAEVELYLEAANWDVQTAIEIWSHLPHGPRVENGEIIVTKDFVDATQNKDADMMSVSVSDEEAEAAITELVQLTGLARTEAEQYLAAGNWEVQNAANLFFNNSQHEPRARVPGEIGSYSSDTSSDRSSKSVEQSESCLTNHKDTPMEKPMATNKIALWPPMPGETNPYDDDFHPSSSTPPRRNVKRRRSEEDEYEAELERQQHDCARNNRMQDQFRASRHQLARQYTRNFFVNNPLVHNPVSRFFGRQLYNGFAWCATHLMDAAERQDEYMREQWRLAEIRKREMEIAAERERQRVARPQPNSFTVPDSSSDDDSDDSDEEEWSSED